MRPEKFWAKIAEFPFVLPTLVHFIGESGWGRSIALSYHLAQELPERVKWIACRPYNKRVANILCGARSNPGLVLPDEKTDRHLVTIDTYWTIFFSEIKPEYDRSRNPLDDEHYTHRTHHFYVPKSDETVGQAIRHAREFGNDTMRACSRGVLRVDAEVCMRNKQIIAHRGLPRRAAAGDVVAGMSEKEVRTVDVYILNPNLK